MAEQQQPNGRTDAQKTTGTAMKRRGLMAAAAALVAGMVAKQASVPVAAAAINLVFSNDPATIFYNTPANEVNIFGPATSDRPQVFRATSNTPLTDAIIGDATGGGRNGVVGKSSGGEGVRGQIPSTSSSANTVAVKGLNQSTGAGGIGVYG